jgi:hypothetical protein
MFLTFTCLDPSKVEITKRFYERLGYNFAPEQHGKNGLPHVSTEIASMPVEIYPPIKGLPPSECLFVGIYVAETDSPEALKSELIRDFGGEGVDVPTTKSGIATLRDPNRILVRLFPKAMAPTA